MFEYLKEAKFTVLTELAIQHPCRRSRHVQFFSGSGHGHVEIAAFFSFIFGAVVLGFHEVFLLDPQ
ncbi:hypothetical protein D3C75_1281200 [compost metagenome]